MAWIFTLVASHSLVWNIHGRHTSMLRLNHISSPSSTTSPSLTKPRSLSRGAIIFRRFPSLKHRFQILKLIKFKIIGLLHHWIQNHCLILLRVRSLGAVALLRIMRLLATLSFAKRLMTLLRVHLRLVWSASIGGLFDFLLDPTEFKKLKIISLIIDLLFGLLLRIKIWSLGIFCQGLPTIRLFDLFLFEFWNQRNVGVRKWISISSGLRRVFFLLFWCSNVFRLYAELVLYFWIRIFALVSHTSICFRCCNL